MKVKNESKKLSLNKETVTVLTDKQQKQINGGDIGGKCTSYTRASSNSNTASKV